MKILNQVPLRKHTTLKLGGYAAFSLMDAKDGILTVEYKLNLMAPADGEMLIARGAVIRPGMTLTVCRAEVDIIKDGMESI